MNSRLGLLHYFDTIFLTHDVIYFLKCTSKTPQKTADASTSMLQRFYGVSQIKNLTHIPLG